MKTNNQKGFTHIAILAFVVVAVAILGTYLLVKSHAETPLWGTKTYNDPSLCTGDSYTDTVNDIYHNGTVADGHKYTYTGSIIITITRYKSGPSTTTWQYSSSPTTKHNGKCKNGHGPQKYQHKTIRSKYSNTAIQG